MYQGVRFLFYPEETVATYAKFLNSIKGSEWIGENGDGIRWLRIHVRIMGIISVCVALATLILILRKLVFLLG